MRPGTNPSPEGGMGYNELQQLKTVGEILETAQSFERAAQHIYSRLSAQLDHPLRELVQELADEEMQHVHLFAELAINPEAAIHGAEQIQAPANDHKFAEYLELPNIDQLADEQSILQYALGREQAAMEHYAVLAEATPEGPIRDLFRFLANEELAHKAELEKRYHELI